MDPTLPTPHLEAFRTSRAADWAELERLVRAPRASRSGGDVLRLAALHRAVAADLALARRRFPEEVAVGALEALVTESHLALRGSARPSWRSAAPAALVGWWRLLGSGPEVALAAALVALPALGVALWHASDPVAAAGVVPVAARRALAAGEPVALVGAVAATTAFVLGALGLVGGALALVWAGVVVGGTLAVAGGAAPGLAAVGAPVLVGLVLAGAAGLRAGSAPWRGRPWADGLREGVALAGGAVPLLAFGALLASVDGPPGLLQGAGAALGLAAAATATAALVLAPRRPGRAQPPLRSLAER